MSNAIGGIAGAGSAYAMSGASAAMAPSQKMSALFDKIDTSGTGTIDKTQLQTAFATQRPPKSFRTMGVDALYKQLDPNNTGKVDKQQFVNTMTSLMSHFKNAGTVGSAGTGQSVSSASLDQSLQLLKGTGSTFSIAA